MNVFLFFGLVCNELEQIKGHDFASEQTFGTMTTASLESLHHWLFCKIIERQVTCGQSVCLTLKSQKAYNTRRDNYLMIMQYK